jgi:hypothetical protein
MRRLRYWQDAPKLPVVYDGSWPGLPVRLHAGKLPAERLMLADDRVERRRGAMHRRGASLCPSTRWETIMGTAANTTHRQPWNKGKIVGQKAPFKLKDIWALRVRLQMERRVRELALFNLGVDSKLRGCDLVALRVRDVCHGDQVASRAVVSDDFCSRVASRLATPGDTSVRPNPRRLGRGARA